MYRLVCAACNERVMDLDSIEFEGKVYHESCFVCHECQQVMSDAGEAQCSQGKIVCHECNKGPSVPSLLRYLFPGQQEVQSPSPLRRSRGRMNDSSLNEPIRKSRYHLDSNESFLNEPIPRSKMNEPSLNEPISRSKMNEPSLNEPIRRSKLESKNNHLEQKYSEAEYKIQRLEKENEHLKEQYKKSTEHYQSKIKALEQELFMAHSEIKKTPSDMADLELKRMQKESLESQVHFLQQQQASLRHYVQYAEQVIRDYAQLKEKQDLLQKQVDYLQQTKKLSTTEQTESIYPSLNF